MNAFPYALIGVTPAAADLSEKMGLFGQFVGEWDFDWSDGERQLPGEWIFSWVLEGTAVQDVFICPSRRERFVNPQPDAEYGTTVRFYNPAKDAWDICHGGSGFMHILEARQVGDLIIVENKTGAGDGGLNRWVFSEITGNSFRWQNRTSGDGGATWEVHCELFARRRDR